MSPAPEPYLHHLPLGEHLSEAQIADVLRGQRKNPALPAVLQWLRNRAAASVGDAQLQASENRGNRDYQLGAAAAYSEAALDLYRIATDPAEPGEPGDMDDDLTA